MADAGIRPRRSLRVRREAARVAVKAARLQGKIPDPRLVELANAALAPEDRPRARSLPVRREAARVAVKAARLQGKTPDPRLVELASLRLPGDLN